MAASAEEVAHGVDVDVEEDERAVVGEEAAALVVKVGNALSESKSSRNARGSRSRGIKTSRSVSGARIARSRGPPPPLERSLEES